MGLLNSNDIIAAEAHFHRDCYKKYVTRKVTCEVEQNLDACKTIELDSFKKVVKYCLTVDEKPHILKFNDLYKEMKENLKSENHEIRQSTRLSLQRNLEKLDILKFLTISSRKYVYHKSIKIEDLMKMHVDLQNRLQENVTKEKESIVKTAAKLIHSEILQMKDSLPWPPQTKDLEPKKFFNPEKLKEFLSKMFHEEERPKTRKSRICYSFVQDIVYGVTNDKVKTPKSILLPTMTKSLTNNSELINVLNRLGHIVSYSTLLESQTENAFRILDHQLRSGCIIPEECQAESFTIFIADNTDRNEETLSGSLYSKCVF